MTTTYTAQNSGPAHTVADLAHRILGAPRPGWETIHTAEHSTVTNGLMRSAWYLGYDPTHLDTAAAADVVRHWTTGQLLGPHALPPSHRYHGVIAQAVRVIHELQADPAADIFAAAKQAMQAVSCLDGRISMGTTTSPARLAAAADAIARVLQALVPALVDLNQAGDTRVDANDVARMHRALNRPESEEAQ